MSMSMHAMAVLPADDSYQAKAKRMNLKRTAVLDGRNYADLTLSGKRYVASSDLVCGELVCLDGYWLDPNGYRIQLLAGITKHAHISCGGCQTEPSASSKLGDRSPSPNGLMSVGPAQVQAEPYLRGSGGVSGGGGGGGIVVLVSSAPTFNVQGGTGASIGANPGGFATLLGPPPTTLQELRDGFKEAAARGWSGREFGADRDAARAARDNDLQIYRMWQENRALVERCARPVYALTPAEVETGRRMHQDCCNLERELAIERELAPVRSVEPEPFSIMVDLEDV